MASTPTHDEHGRPLLTDAEYHKLHMMDPVEFMNIPKAQQEAYARTHKWHFEQRMGDFDVNSIQTGDGKTFREKLEEYKDRFIEDGWDCNPQS